MKKLLLELGFFIALGAFVIGCGGGGSSSSGGGNGGNGGNGGTDPVLAAITDMNKLIRGEAAVNATSLAASKDKFITAITAQPNNVDAKTGYALIEAALSAQMLLDLYGPTYTDDDILNLGSPILDLASNMRLNSLGKGANLPQGGFVSPENLIRTLPFIGQTNRLGQAEPLPWVVANTLANSESHIGNAIALLNSIDDAAPASVIGDSSPDSGETSSTATASFGAAERKLLMAILRAWDAQCKMINAYNYSFGSFNAGAQAISSYSTYLNNGSLLLASNYLPASPFLTLKSNSATLLSDAKSQWKLSADNAVSGLNLLKARTTGDNTIEVGSYTTGGIDGTVALMNEYKTYTDGPIGSTEVLLVDGQHSLTVDLSKLFTAPPADLKVFFPNFLPGSIDPDYFLDPDPDTNSGLDLTLGGLIPDEIPIETMIDNRSLTVTSASTTGDVVAFGLNIFTIVEP